MTIALRLTAKMTGWQYRKVGPDVESLSDRTLADIGFKLARRDLDAVKPFWTA